MEENYEREIVETDGNRLFKTNSHYKGAIEVNILNCIMREIYNLSTCLN